MDFKLLLSRFYQLTKYNIIFFTKVNHEGSRNIIDEILQTAIYFDIFGGVPIKWGVSICQN